MPCKPLQTKSVIFNFIFYACLVLINEISTIKIVCDKLFSRFLLKKKMKDTAGIPFQKEYCFENSMVIINAKLFTA